MRQRIGQTKSLVIIAYDTPCNRRRRKLARVADDYGCRVQMSVFFGWLTKSMRESLVIRIHAIIDPEEDSVFVLPACATCEKQTICFGKARFDPLPLCWIV